MNLIKEYFEAQDILNWFLFISFADDVKVTIFLRERGGFFNLTLGL